MRLCFMRAYSDLFGKGPPNHDESALLSVAPFEGGSIFGHRVRHASVYHRGTLCGFGTRWLPRVHNISKRHGGESERELANGGGARASPFAALCGIHIADTD